MSWSTRTSQPLIEVEVMYQLQTPGPHAPGDQTPTAASTAIQQRQFAARVAHELRTPLAAMRLRVEEALLYSQDTDPCEALAGALTSVERLERVINDFLPLTPAALAHLAATGDLAPT